MTYAILPLPHSNRRYSEAVRPLALSELKLLAPAAGIDVQSLRYETISGLELLLFEAEPLSPDDILLLRSHSAAQALFAVESGLLRPLMEGREQYLPSGMSGILKYKGKTNEQFCALLINAAVFSGAFAAKWKEPLHIIDPLCGRGTSLYVAVERGYNATGVEIDTKDGREARSFAKQFLEYHRLKHSRADSSLACGPGKSAQATAFTFAPDKEAYKAGDTRTLRFVRGDSREAGAMFRPGTFDALIADLPYGVQHEGAGDPSAAKLLRDSLPGWASILKTGAALAVSFNEYTLPFSHAVKLLEDAGLEPAPIVEADFSHWVEQAIRRNLVVGIKR